MLNRCHKDFVMFPEIFRSVVNFQDRYVIFNHILSGTAGTDFIEVKHEIFLLTKFSRGTCLGLGASPVPRCLHIMLSSLFLVLDGAIAKNQWRHANLLGV